jgi:hypothetical protein
MSDINNMPCPDFADEDAQAVQIAQNALQSGRNKPLEVPADAEVFTSEKTGTKYSRFTEQVTVEQAYRSITEKGKMDIAVMLRVRQSAVNSGRVFWAHFYIAPSTLGLNDNQLEYREKQRGLMFGLIEKAGLKPDSGNFSGALQNMCFPQKGEPGKSSLLVGKVLYSEICQQDKVAEDKNGKKVQLEDGTYARDIRDNVEGWVAETVEE